MSALKRSYCVIAAQSADGIIGVNGRLPWRIPYDWSHFKRTTFGGVLLSGRKSFEESGLLKGRSHVVVSRSREYIESLPTSVRGEGTVSEALGAASAIASQQDCEIFICGGENIYQYLLPDATRLVLTTVNITLAERYPKSARLTRFPQTWKQRFGPASLKSSEELEVNDYVGFWEKESVPGTESRDGLMVKIEEFVV